METATKLVFPDEVHKIWLDLKVQNPIWERPFPPKYLTTAPSLQASIFGHLESYSARGGPAQLVATVPVTPAPVVPPGTAPAPPLVARRVQETHRNVYPNRNEAAFMAVKHRVAAGKKRFKDIVLAAEAAGNPVPKNARGWDMCVTFHVIGNCSNICNRQRDHHDLAGGAKHTKAEDDKLLQWCERAVPVE